MQRKSARHLRIEGEMHRALAELIAREVKDPRVGSVTVTAVTAAPDLSEARIFFLPFAGTHPAAEVLAGLTRAAGFLRGEVGRRLQLRHAPRLTFVVDEQFDRAARLTALIDTASRHDAELARGCGTDGAEGRATGETHSLAAGSAPTADAVATAAPDGPELPDTSEPPRPAGRQA